MFVDRAYLTAKAGNGGNGCVSFHREKFVQNGGPDGGDGGDGGDILLMADPNMHTLMDFRFKQKYEAENGVDGMAGRGTGKRGDSVLIKLPVGTVVRDRETGALCADMFTPGETRVLLHGGRGGFGNARFATPTRQAPNFAKPGIRTPRMEFTLELKTIADVGLVGFPNVGKSTLLSVLTAAKPKIANYHFTTLTPNLGIARVDGMDFAIADIPGLCEGAADGKGLGHDFLRHVERTRLIVHVLDAAGTEGRDPIEDYEAIRKELDAYGDVASKPEIVAANKLDAGRDALDALVRHLSSRGVPVFPISAATREGLTELVRAIASALRELPPIEPFHEESLQVGDTNLTEFIVRREGDAWIVEGEGATHLIDSVNFSNEDSLNWFHHTLRRTGVIDELRAKGAQEGDTVRMADMEFDFVD